MGKSPKSVCVNKEVLKGAIPKERMRNQGSLGNRGRNR